MRSSEHGAASRHGSASAGTRSGPGGPDARPPAAAASASPHLWRARSRHQQLPPAGRAPGRGRLHRHRRLLARRPARRRAGDQRPDQRRGDGPRASPRSSVCAEKLRRRRVSLARSVATEACRRAVNGRHFVERVRRETGICLEIIAPEEEARLAMLGCHRLLEPGDGPALIFDIGGGSTELVLIDTDGGEPADQMLVERALGRRFADRERGPRLRRRRRAARRLRPDARARPPRLPPLRRAAAARDKEQYPADGHERHGDHAGQRPSRLAELRPARGRRADDAGRGDARRSARCCRG